MTQHRILLPLVNAALILAQAVPASAQSPGPDLIARHGAAVTELVRRQIAEQPGARDQERIALVGDLLKRRPDIAGARAVEPIDRRTAVAAGLGNNLRLAIGLTTPERAAALSREADAVFNPVLDLTIGYGRADTEHRTRIGKAITKAVNADGFNINSPFKNLPPSENEGQAQIKDMKLRPIKGGELIELPIEATPGRTFGSPEESLNYTLQITQELPWGGTLSITDRTAQREVYYRAGYYWEDGMWSTNLSGSLNMPLPFTKDFGPDNKKNAASRSAAAVAERADWDLQVLLNTILLEIDTAYFEAVRRLEALETTAANRDMILRQQERMDRLYALNQTTRLQKAQIDAEAARARVRVEQALSDYVSASQALSLLIGDPSVIGADAIYLPVDYEDDLAQAVPVDLETALRTARESRPDFKVDDINRILREINEALARNQARLDLRFVASVTAGQNGTSYGYADPLKSHTGIAAPDSLNQSYGLGLSYPWANRSAGAGADIARLGTQDQEYATQSLQNRVRREIAERLAAVQAARARVRAGAAEVDNLATSVASLERRQALTGTVSEDELIQATRRLLSARLALTGARVDAKQAESGLLFAQGTIAGALAEQTVASQFDRNRLSLLADAGHLSFFKPAESRPDRIAKPEGKP
ncbi:TolC family protein [Skermanella sp. TT6]|uniref:TolC family protein n=1 Tax=Skermanella cutis TaxID=2775420 RepID=A0ABX7BC02_9PROT|nr:TolC family protein [Skermanella sp. TT6]QQP91929.1 TolC family protein [Skermanella sp. TT6]